MEFYNYKRESIEDKLYHKIARAKKAKKQTWWCYKNSLMIEMHELIPISLWLTLTAWLQQLGKLLSSPNPWAMDHRADRVKKCNSMKLDSYKD